MRFLGSLRTALALSFIAWLTLLFRSYVDTRYVLVEDYPQLGRGLDVIWFFGFTLIIGGWAWAMIRAGQGRRAGWIACLVYAVVTTLWFGLGSFLFFYSEPAEIILFGTNLVGGLMAAIAAGRRLQAVTPT